MQVHLVNAVCLFVVLADDASCLGLEFLEFGFKFLVGVVRYAERERAHDSRHLGACDERLLRKFKTLQLVLLDEFRIVVRTAGDGFLGRLPETRFVLAGEAQLFQKRQRVLNLSEWNFREDSLLYRCQVICNVHSIKNSKHCAMVPMVIVFVSVRIEDMLRIGVQVQQFFHGGATGGFGFCLVELHHGLEVLGGLLVEAEDFDKLGCHAGADLFPSENIGKVAARLGEAEHIADSGTGEFRVGLDSGRLVFFQVLAEVRKLVNVDIVFHESNIIFMRTKVRTFFEK